MNERANGSRSRLALWAWIFMLYALAQLNSCSHRDMRNQVRDLQQRISQIESEKR
jgi:hypothetical protein